MSGQSKKLIEVSLPLEAINAASVREKGARKGHSSTLHHWWARRPLAACRAAIIGCLVDDPSSRVDLPTKAAQDDERARIHKVIASALDWDLSEDSTEITELRKLLHDSGEEETCVLDPFAGGGSIPLEAVRLGLSAHANDLNPVACLINTGLLTIPSSVKGRAPCHPKAERISAFQGGGALGLSGLAKDIELYGQDWIRTVRQELNYIYAIMHVAAPSGAGQQKALALESASVSEVEPLAWIWTWTSQCPNPTCSAVVPLCGTIRLAKISDSEFLVAEPLPSGERPSFKIGRGVGKGEDTGRTTAAHCPTCRTVATYQYVRQEGKRGRLGQSLVATMVRVAGKKEFVLGTRQEEDEVLQLADRRPSGDDLPSKALGFRVQGYGLSRFSDLFSKRQRLFLMTAAEHLAGIRKQVAKDSGDENYARCLISYLAFALGRTSDYCSMMTFLDARSSSIAKTFSLPTLQMRLAFSEINPFADISGNLPDMIGGVADVVARLPAPKRPTAVTCGDAALVRPMAGRVLVCTDPPYYDNIGYASLSDFFYIWLREALKEEYPDWLALPTTPKSQEIIAEPGRHDSVAAAGLFFEERIFGVFRKMYEIAGDLPVAIFYAFKQSSTESGQVSSTGWERFLAGILDAGFQVTATWPLRTEQKGGLRVVGRNSLASSILLVCRRRDPTADATSRAHFLSELRAAVPSSLAIMQEAGISPVDLPQAALGPGMAVFSRYATVLAPDGAGGTRPMRVREALHLINQVLDEFLSESDADLDAETRVAVSWFEQRGFDSGPFGDLEGLLKARNTATNSMVGAGILEARGGKARLLSRDELPRDWDPATDPHLTVWECLQHAIRVHRDQGSEACGALVAKMRGKDEDVRSLAYRMYTLCERKKWAEEARAYNEFIADWGQIQQHARRAAAEWKGPLDQFHGGA